MPTERRPMDTIPEDILPPYHSPRQRHWAVQAQMNLRLPLGWLRCYGQRACAPDMLAYRGLNRWRAERQEVCATQRHRRQRHLPFGSVEIIGDDSLPEGLHEQMMRYSIGGDRHRQRLGEWRAEIYLPAIGGHLGVRQRVPDRRRNVVSDCLAVARTLRDEYGL